MSYKPKNILVTGGAGFIGSNFIRYLLKEDSDVSIVNLDLMTYAGNADNLANLPDPERHTFVKGDICNQALIEKLMRENEIDTVVHFAAESHVDRSIEGPMAFIKTNILGTFTLLEVARKYWLEERQLDASSCRFHHISTDEVYGSLDFEDAPFNEQSRYDPSSPYSASKASSDHLVMAYHRTYGMPITLSNCSNNYGPYQHTEKLIPTVIKSCFHEKPIPVYGKGLNVRDWIYVDDHNKDVLLILRHANPGETYNIGGGNEVANITLVKQICQLMDEIKPLSAPYAELITYVTDRKGHDLRYAIDSLQRHKIKGLGQYQPLETRLKETVNWYVRLFEKQIAKVSELA